MTTEAQIKSNCPTCGLRKKADENPKSLIARFWRWHTTWCPGWKAYKVELAELGLDPPTV